MKMTKKAQERIASLITSTHVAAIMITDARADKNFESMDRWMDHDAVAVVSLAEEFGIVLPNLFASRQRVARTGNKLSVK